MTTKLSRQKLRGIQGLVLDAFGTLCTGASLGSFVPWHRHEPGETRRAIRQAWMRGEIGPAELVRQGRAQDAPPASVLEAQLRAGLGSVRAYEDVPGVLDVLSGYGYRLAIVSNTAAPFGDALVDRFGPWISHYVFSYEHAALKPAPELFATAAALLDLPPSRILVVGDSPRNDIAGAQAAGMPAVLVDRRGRADDSLAGLSELPRILR